jgi:hypothetical protein
LPNVIWRGLGGLKTWKRKRAKYDRKGGKRLIKRKGKSKWKNVLQKGGGINKKRVREESMLAHREKEGKN